MEFIAVSDLGWEEEKEIKLGEIILENPNILRAVWQEIPKGYHNAEVHFHQRQGWTPWPVGRSWSN